MVQCYSTFREKSKFVARLDFCTMEKKKQRKERRRNQVCFYTITFLERCRTFHGNWAHSSKHQLYSGRRRFVTRRQTATGDSKQALGRYISMRLSFSLFFFLHVLISITHTARFFTFLTVNGAETWENGNKMTREAD